MADTFFDRNFEYEIKIFQIDKSFYELRSFDSNEKKILHIVDEHRKKVEDLESVGRPIHKNEYDNVTYYSYLYNELEKESYWKSFLPSSITEHHNFEIKKLSFVLFASIQNQIFAIIGGGGIRVIKRYINRHFGIDFYEYLTTPSEDKIISLTVRGISGKRTEQHDKYRDGQVLLDSLDFSDIPTKINLILRDDLKNTVFDFIQFPNEKIHIEIGSYFHLKHKVSFIELHQLFYTINEIMTNYKPTPLTAFVRVKDKGLIENEYQKNLIEQLVSDAENMFSISKRKQAFKKFDIDFLHPTKLQAFYECNKYELKAYQAKVPFFTTSDKHELYKAGLKYLYEKVKDRTSDFEFTGMVFGMRVLGYKNEELKTEAMFLHHLTCEISYMGKPVFLIDNTWYKVKNNFIESINKKCIQMLDVHCLHNDILYKYWDRTLDDEGEYNQKYNGEENYYVFDKILNQNIELCDVMFESENSIFLIHIKDGFDAKMRDLANQIQISADRLKTDISSHEPEYLIGTIDRYNSETNNKIDKDEFISKFRTKEIVYVMAFKSNWPDLSLNERIIKSKSNIAKYSLIQCVQEMSKEYQLKLFDISDNDFL